MAHILAADAQAWADGTKLTITSLDPSLVAQLSEEVIRRLDSGFDVTGWTNDTNTPTLVKVIIAKLYVAWVYDRQYSEDIEQGSNYADRLKANAEMLMTGLLEGAIELPGADVTTFGSPVFYPTDASSAEPSTYDDPSLGPAAFSMGMRF